MKILAPNYYSSFKCIAGNCKHSCCIGWEIDIDEESLSRYKNIPAPFGTRLADNISVENSCAHFTLDSNERCPFLNQDGLCDIILTCGEDAICQICADHPRFRNFFSDRTEIGLGLCCEAAAKLILTYPEKVQFSELECDGYSNNIPDYELQFLNFRDKIFEILQNRRDSIDSRIDKMLSVCGGNLPENGLHNWYEIFIKLERLDPAWDSVLDTLTRPSSSVLTHEFDVAFEHLLVYFTFRHLSSAYEDGRISARASFVALSFNIVRSLFYAYEHKTIEKLVELARMYSSEIEYSEDNISTLLDILEQ